MASLGACGGNACYSIKLKIRIVDYFIVQAFLEFVTSLLDDDIMGVFGWADEIGPQGNKKLDRIHVTI